MKVDTVFFYAKRANAHAEDANALKAHPCFVHYMMFILIHTETLTFSA